VLANGFLIGPHSYLRSNWNVMDGSLVILSLFDVAVSLSATQGQRNSLGILRVFRLLRTLRPLRLVSILGFPLDRQTSQHLLMNLEVLSSKC